MTSTSTHTTTHTTTKLSKQRILMDRVVFRDEQDDELVIFAESGEGRVDREAQRSCSQFHQDWVDMGSPDVVTITIEPGDHLTDDHAEEGSA